MTTTMSLIQDPAGKGGTATLVRWYRRWMERHDPTHRELFLDDEGPSGLRRLRAWAGESPGIPRVLPRLHLSPYWLAARRLRQLRIPEPGTNVHVVGASAMHGSLLRTPASVVWFATLIHDERQNSMKGRSLSRRLLYSATLRPLQSLEREVLGAASRVLAMSHHTAHLAEECGAASKESIEVVPVPVDTDHYTPADQDGLRQGVLFVGRASDPRKAFHRVVTLVETSSLVRQREVTVISPGSRLTHHQAMRWLGPVTDLASEYRCHELLVLPSHQEGLGIVAFEAMACGTPVVAWRCGGPDQFLEESGAAILVDAAREFREAVESLLRDRAECRRLGLAGRAYVEENFSAARFLDNPTIFAVP